MVGMFLKQRFDVFAVKLQLLGQSAEQLAQAHGQLAFGSNNRFGGLELIGLGEELQAFLGCLGPPKLMGVKELLPTAFAGGDQS